MFHYNHFHFFVNSKERCKVLNLTCEHHLSYDVLDIVIIGCFLYMSIAIIV
jgi:hypothetical protein